MTNNELRSLQFCSTMFHTYDYKRLFVAASEEGYWLLNATQDSFPLIYVVTQDTTLDAKAKVVLLALRKQMEELMNRPLRLTIINFGSTRSEWDNVMVSECVVDEDGFLPLFLEALPEVQNSFYEMDNEELVEKEIARLREELFPAKEMEVLQKSVQAKQSRYPKWFIVVASICIGVFLLANLVGYLIDDVTISAILFGGMYTINITNAYEYWRFLAAGFLHIEVFHILANLVSLFNISVLASKLFRTKDIVFILILSILFGNVSAFVFSPGALTLGISGGVFGLLAACFMNLFMNGGLKEPRIRNAFLQVLFINIFISFLPSISLAGHMGGIVGGVISGAICSLPKLRDSLKLHSKIAVSLFTLVAIIVLPMKQQPPTLYAGTDSKVVNILKGTPLSFYGDYLDGQYTKIYESKGMLEIYEMAKGR